MDELESGFSEKSKFEASLSLSDELDEDGLDDSTYLLGDAVVLTGLVGAGISATTTSGPRSKRVRCVATD